MGSQALDIVVLRIFAVVKAANAVVASKQSS